MALSDDFTAVAREKARAAKRYMGDVTDTYTPTLKKATLATPGAVRKTWGAGKTVAAAGAGYVAGAARTARYGLEDLRRGSLWWVFWAFLLYVGDVLLAFGGFDYNVLFRLFSQLDFNIISRLFINGVVIAIWVSYALLKWQTLSKREFISFVVLTEVIVVSLTLGGASLALFFHIGFAIAALFLLFYPAIQDKAQANILVAILLLADLYLFSFIAEIAPNLPYLNRLILPIWFIVTLVYSRPSGWRNILVFLVIMFYVLNAVNIISDFRAIGTAALTQKEVHTFKEFVDQVLDNAKQLVKLPQQFVETQKRIALGEYYTGDIDKRAQERLGVYMLDIYASQTRPYYETDTVIVSADIEAQTLKDPIPIVFSCETESVPGKVEPISTEVDFYERQTVDCTFPRLSQGSHEVTITANFNFESSAYRIGYFADEEDYRSRRLTPENYLLAKGSPYVGQSTVTSGPLNIGMAIGDKVVRVGRTGVEESIRFVVDFTLMPGWEGEIKKINQIILQIPKSIELREEGVGSGLYCGGKEFERISCADLAEEGCEDDVYNLYKLNASDERIEKITATGIERLPCRIQIVDVNELFGERGIDFVRKAFRVLVAYDHTLEKKIGIQVQKGESIKSNLLDCTTQCRDTDGCFCPSGCKLTAGTTVKEGRTCGVLGLPKGKLGLPAGSKCNIIKSCVGNVFTIGCSGDAKDDDKKAIGVFKGGEVSEIISDETVIVSYNTDSITYDGLERTSITKEGQIVNEPDLIGTFEEQFTFSIQKDGKNIHLIELYEKGQFKFEDKSCEEAT